MMSGHDEPHTWRAVLHLPAPARPLRPQVIMFDPMYDSYVSMAKRSGGVIRPVRLRLPDFSVPVDELAAAFSDKTKLLLVNSPHNPSGKVGVGAGACVVCTCVGGGGGRGRGVGGTCCPACKAATEPQPAAGCCS